MGLKEIYLKGEDKWYEILDRIDAHVPIYKVVDKIDGVVPSFALFIALVALLVLLFAAMSLTAGSLVSLTITVEDAEGNLLEGVSFDYAIGSTVNSAVTNAIGQAAILVPAGSSVEITVAKTTLGERNFEQARQAVLVEKASTSAKIVLKEESPAFVERTLVFQNAAGERMAGKAIKVRLSCQNPLVTPSPLEVSDLDLDGAITVREPRDCGIFQATVIEPVEFKQKSYVLSQGTQTLKLEERDVAKGIVRVRIKDSSGKLVLSSNFDVKLLDSDGMKAGEKYSQNYGETIFTDVTAGTYSATIEDASGDYGMASAAGIEVSANETASVDILASKSVKVTLTVKVLDKGSGARISGATLRVVDAEGRTIAEKTTVSGEDTVFKLTDQGSYWLSAMHDDYLYETVELGSGTTQDIEVEMEKITASNSGRVEVEIVDEDNLPVKNAKVKLRFLGTGMLVPVEQKITDRNGFASFSGMKPGSYYAYAEKFPAAGDNKEEGKEIDIKVVTKFKVRLLIGNSLVQIKAFDEDSQPVREAEAEFFSLSGESLGKIPLTDGTGQFDLKADKQVFAVISHPDFMAVQTMPVQLWPGKLVKFDALMEPKLILGEPNVEFDGIYDSAGMRVQEMKAGNKYVARFKLSVPEEGNYGKGGFHFRVGDEALLVNDPLVIKDAIAGWIIAPLKGTTYTPPLGYEQDSESVTEGDAKWINISWPNLKPMNYYFGFEVRVKSQVMPYTRLPMHYRAWAIDDSDYYIRAPADAELGNAESVSGKQALYAKTLDIAFLEGQPAECLDDFCYSGESILDQDEGLYIHEPYEMRAGAPHLYTFSILNNSARQYSNSQLYITVDGIAIEGYKIQNASAQEISKAGISAKSAEGIDLGGFTKGKSISGEVNLKPNAQGPGSIELKIIADGRIVFLKTIPAQVVAEKSMAIGVSPATIPSYIDNIIEVQVKELLEGQGFELKDALVKLSITNPDKTEAFYSGTTNRLGIATFGLLPLDPGTKIRIEAEKPGYYAEPVIKIVDSNILLFTPNIVQASLDTRGLTEKTFVVGIESVIGKDATIKGVELTGQFRGLLDEMTMENFTKQYIGTTIPANGTETLQLFKVVLSKNAKEMILRNEKLSGEYHITAEDRETGIVWDFIIPLKVDIKLGGLPDNSPCISISQREWVSATQGNRATMEFEIRNNCMSGNRFVDLENLQAKLLWIGDAIGTVELSVTEAGGGASNHAVLRSLVWTPLFDAVRAENVYYGILTFTPKAGHLGERAEFEVLINGEIMTDGGPALVGSSPGSIKSSIDVINLEQCIQYLGAENEVEIRETQDFATFTVDSSKCGETPIEIEICYMDSGCKGGAVEGDIGIIPESFKLIPPSMTTKEVRVERRIIPGMYGATIFARIPGSSYREVHVVDVLVRPESDEAFYLDKYDFTILGKDSKDSSILTNTQLEGQFNVRASVCAWGEAAEKGNFDPTGALMGAGVGFAIGVMAPAGTFATLGPSIMGLSFCPPCLAVMGVFAVIGGLIGGLFGEDPCDKDMTQALPDWVINLRDDAKGVSMDNQMIAAGWDVDNPKILGNNERQDVGIWFENLGIEDVKPTYSTATVTAEKHHHANPTNYGKNSNFGSYKVRDQDVTVYTQKFHLKFDTKVVLQEIPPISFDAYECVQGTLVGRTGPGALPRIKLSWDWSDATGIAMDTCDYDNENYVYCDATQFSMELSKKLHAFDNFLEINKDNMVCPTDPITKYMMEYENQFGSRNVKNGYLGLSKVGSAISSNSLEINFEVKNDTASTETATVTVKMTPPDNVDVPPAQLTCVREFDVVAQQSKKGKCTFSELQPSNKFYGFSVNIESSTALLLDTNGFTGSFKVLEEQDSSCWIVQSTTLLDGRPAIEYFLEEAENIVWTPEIPDTEALRNLLHFKAYLMKDGYSEDFQKDFAEYSVTKNFFNSPEWFSDDDSGKFADYFADPYYFGFTRRYVDSSQLPNAGLYDVVLDINFVGGNWDLFDSYGEPNAKINIEFYFLRAAYPNSLFYYLPFDGFVGVDSENGRQGYGMNYENVSDEILVTGSGDGVKTLNIPGSTPVMNIRTDVVDDFEKMNSTASNRGFVLSVEDSDNANQKNMEFYPNYATPVVMKMSQVKTAEPFSAYFELRASGVPLETGDNLTFWDGAGQCLDYTGVPVVEAFDFKPDREADNKDALSNWQFAYAVDWPKADYGGDVYLKTIFYTPIGRLFSLKAVKPSKLKFITPNSFESQSVELDGIAGMKYNSGLAQSRIATLREVFELAAAGDICVTNSGTRTSFWWNPKSLYEASGHNTSIKDFETGLVADKTCIGYGS